MFVSLIFSTFIFIHSSPVKPALAFFPAPGRLNPVEYPLLLTCPKLRFRFCFGSQKKKRILHILFFDQRTGPPRNGASPLLPAYLWAAVSLASSSLSICSPKACPKALFRFICVQQMFPQLSCNAVVCRLLSLPPPPPRYVFTRITSAYNIMQWPIYILALVFFELKINDMSGTTATSIAMVGDHQTQS